MSEIALERVKLEDWRVLQKIGRETFKETFESGNTEENMRDYLANGFSEEKLKSELNNPGSIFYFARIGSIVSGYLKVNFSDAQTELRDESGMEIERIYVLKELHGKKVGQLLFEKALDLAKQSEKKFVWLGVWEENPRAIQFYKKNGFEEFDKHVFIIGDDEQTDIMMRLDL
ncbi:MAG: GNAT family N-acetyltransferase [Bacteroidetes bacterium]|nr:MAG: GNAT family N-acetyltransferase [Bacteroidota bacterium]